VRLLRALRTAGNAEHGGAESDEVVFLCITRARRELPLLPRVARWREAEGKVSPAGLASWKVMSTPRSRRFPVTVTHLPVTRCQICDRTLAYRPGNISEVLTAHYRRAHPEALGIPSE
jgi:hypothetical protein